MILILFIVPHVNAYPTTPAAPSSPFFAKVWSLYGCDLNSGLDTAIDSQGNAYVVGDSSCANGSQTFLLKYNSSGTLEWQRTWGPYFGGGTTVKTDSMDHVHVFAKTITVDGGSATLLLTLDGSGTLLTATQIEDSYFGVQMVLDTSGNKYVLEQAAWGGTPVHYGNGSLAPFFRVLKINSTGELVWQKSFRGSDTFNLARGIAVDSSGDTYVTGCLDCNFDTHYILEGGKLLILKLNSTGSVIYQRAYGSDLDMGYGVFIDPSDNPIITGTYHVGEALVMKLSAAGRLTWARTWSGTGPDTAISAGADSLGDIYVGGWAGNSSFSKGYVYYGTRALLLKLSPSGGLLGQLIWGGQYTSKGYGVALDSSYVLLTGYASAPPYHPGFCCNITLGTSPDSLASATLSVAGANPPALGPADVSVTDTGGVETDNTASCWRTLSHDNCGAVFLLKYSTSSLILPSLLPSPSFVQSLFSRTNLVFMALGALAIFTVLTGIWWLQRKGRIQKRTPGIHEA